MNILITGGASGLGKSITRQLAKAGTNKIYFTYNRSAGGAKELEQTCAGTRALHCDFEDSGSLQALLNQLESLDLDVLINNALTGIQTNHFHKLPAEFFAESFARNVIPVIKITQQALLQFRKKKSGKIITILSNYINGTPPIGLSEYVAQKNYLLSLSKSWAAENAKFNITSNAISPAFMQTGLTRDTDERVIEEMINNSPDKKLLSTGEVAMAVQQLLNAQNVSGKNIIINTSADSHNLQFN
ncbi:MAG: SDR family NAD(P)-dependent oxidoreductase [Bacteroidia bacterium]